MSEQDEILVVYEYTRGGKTFITPNEMIAILRSEDGTVRRKKYILYI